MAIASSIRPSVANAFALFNRPIGLAGAGQQFFNPDLGLLEVVKTDAANRQRLKDLFRSGMFDFEASEQIGADFVNSSGLRIDESSFQERVRLASFHQLAIASVMLFGRGQIARACAARQASS